MYYYNVSGLWLAFFFYCATRIIHFTYRSPLALPVPELISQFLSTCFEWMIKRKFVSAILQISQWYKKKKKKEEKNFVGGLRFQWYVSRLTRASNPLDIASPDQQGLRHKLDLGLDRLLKQQISYKAPFIDRL